MTKPAAPRLWQGRTTAAPDPAFTAFHDSLGFDRRLIAHDIAGSIAWATALAPAGVLTAAESKRLVTALRQLQRRLATDPRPLQTSAAEDVHSFVEAALQRTLGPLARKLHTGRSRNDQVATDLKLWSRDAVTRLRQHTADLMRALAALAKKHAGAPMPGYTHSQRAQPITIGHHALAYVEMLARDRDRLADAARRMDTCPLGSGALAGTAFPIDRRRLARALGFRAATRNSLDAVSDRDHAAEVAFASTMLMLHLSRLCEDWIFFSSSEARFLQLGEEVSTGSSLMPQKKNPDALELVRGKCGRVAGHLQGLLMILKGLPLAYDKDLQEDKEALFDAVDTTDACVRVMTIAVRTARFDTARCRRAAERGQLNATDLADLLVRAGVPFRDAHARVGDAVREALRLGVELEQLPEASMVARFPELAPDWREAMTVAAVLDRRDVLGGTAPRQVRKQATSWLSQLTNDPG